MKTLLPSEVALLRQFIDEVESLIDADDGTCFQCQHIDLLANAKEILEDDESTDT
jgi:hypothetical protein